jgi:UTP:GlnB (protein PII) uridylyltransferase
VGGVRADVEKVLTGEMDGRCASSGGAAAVAAALIGSRKARKRAFTRVSIDNGISPDFTVIDVHAADRPGLLFTLADAIFHLGLTIHLAKITTRVQQVLDVFYVTDAEGAKIEDPERHREISDFIFERIRETETPQPATASSAAAAS